MMSRESRQRLVSAILAEAPRFVERLGGGEWTTLRVRVMEVAGALPHVSDAEGQSLVDDLLTLGFASPAAALFREILRQVLLLPAAGPERGWPPRVEPPPPGPPIQSIEREAGHAGEPEPRERRYVNLCLVRDGGERVPKSTSLGAGRAYQLRIDIGALSAESVVENAGEHPFPAELLPARADGHWLEVIAASGDFSLTSRKWHLFLPRGAASWVCACPPGGEHRCTEPQRAPYLFIPSSAPRRPGSAELRLGIYYGKNLVQSQRLTAEVVSEEAAGEGYRSRIDYTLSAGLGDLDRFPERALHILTNRRANGTHQLVINGKAEDVLALTLTEGQMRGAIDAAREGLRRAHFQERGGQLGAKVVRDNLLDERNAKPRDGLVADLAALAPLGWLLWTALFKGQPAWLEKLRGATRDGGVTIQVSRIAGSEFVFPWALVYDIPLETGVHHAPCRLLSEARALADLASAGAARCPHEGEHARKNVICPFGFWGFKHTIEQPPSVPEEASLPFEIRVRAPGLRLLMGLSTEMDKKLLDAHVEALRTELAGLGLTREESRAEIRDEMARTDLQVIYFYCHGKRDVLPGAMEPQPCLEVGRAETITPADILAWAQADWPPAHWRTVSPLVFINGCHTAELTPEALVGFVDTFAGVYAAGVIGTEITIHQRLANEAALEIFRHLHAEAPVGDALRRMRLHFLAKGNVLGLAYTPYCSAALRLRREDT